MALRYDWLLLHGEDVVIVVYGHHATLVQTGLVGLEVAHDATGPFVDSIAHEGLQAEVEDIVASDDEKVIVEVQFVDGKLNVAYGAEARLVGARAVINDGDVVRVLGGPCFEVMSELMVADDDEAVHEVAVVDIIDEPVQDGLVAHLQERLWEILC